MNLHEEIDRQKQLMGVSETPHRIKSREFGELNFTDENALTFEYRDGKLYIAPHATHGGGITSFYQQTLGQEMKNVTSEDIRGRIWWNDNIITFWKYPASQGELIIVIEDIYREVNRIRKTYPNLNFPAFDIKYVEIPWNAELGQANKDWGYEYDFSGSSNFKIVNVEDFEKYYSTATKPSVFSR